MEVQSFPLAARLLEGYAGIGWKYLMTGFFLKEIVMKFSKAKISVKQVSGFVMGLGALVLTAHGAEFDDVYSGYKKTFQGELKSSSNGSYWATFASIAARHAVSQGIANGGGVVVADQGANQNARGDVTIGGITVQPGAEIHATTIVIQNHMGDTVVTGRR